MRLVLAATSSDDPQRQRSLQPLELGPLLALIGARWVRSRPKHGQLACPCSVTTSSARATSGWRLRKKTMYLAVQQISDAVSLMHNSRRMTIATLPKRLGFFTRLLDQADPTERYRLATAQIIHAERFGFDSAWIAQHHFHEDEGGLPAPFVFLAQVAAQTTPIRLRTGIVTLPLELPIRVAEDSAVLDLMCGGRLEVGVGGGGNLSSYAAFGPNNAERATLLGRALPRVRDAWAGRPLPGGGDQLYPANSRLVERVWQATFTVDGARRAGAAGDGLMLSRTQPRPANAPDLSLAKIQN